MLALLEEIKIDPFWVMSEVEHFYTVDILIHVFEHLASILTKNNTMIGAPGRCKMINITENVISAPDIANSIC